MATEQIQMAGFADAGHMGAAGNVGLVVMILLVILVVLNLYKKMEKESPTLEQAMVSVPCCEGKQESLLYGDKAAEPKCSKGRRGCHTVLLLLLAFYAYASGLYKGSLVEMTWIPPEDETVLLTGYWLALFFFWYMDLAFFFVVGSCSAAVTQYYFIVKLMHVPPHLLDFGVYTFLVPIETGSINALGFYIATKYLGGGSRYYLRYIITWCMGIGANVQAGWLSDYHTYYEGWEYLQYLSGSMALYCFVIFGIIPFLERIVKESVPTKPLSST